jgi:hypothetical protein
VPDGANWLCYGFPVSCEQEELNEICRSRGVADYSSSYSYYGAPWVPSQKYTSSNWGQSWSGMRSGSTIECAWSSNSGDLVSCSFIINSSNAITNRTCTSPFVSW